MSQTVMSLKLGGAISKQRAARSSQAYSYGAARHTATEQQGAPHEQSETQLWMDFSMLAGQVKSVGCTGGTSETGDIGNK
jgi:hypothetical protein